ncbi:MAG: hypothetical protein JXB45_03530, partial [Candidatus Krumholzibacteriota bacterium]|nr:hypothetical protein [Candidatus Krumholzibacteriota bacterium]
MSHKPGKMLPLMVAVFFVTFVIGFIAGDIITGAGMTGSLFYLLLALYKKSRFLAMGITAAVVLIFGAAFKTIGQAVVPRKWKNRNASSQSLLDKTDAYSPAERLAAIPEKDIRKYQKSYSRELNPFEILLIDAWHKALCRRSTLYTFPRIPTRKLESAKASYAPVDEGELIIGLQDDTWAFSRTAKKGFLVTTAGIFWKTSGSPQSDFLSFREI